MQKITKAIIATAGYGTRRLPITKTVEKNMLPVGNRPIVDYVVEECVKAGITDIYMVVNDIEKSQIKAYYGENLVLSEFLTARGAEAKLEKLKTAPEGVRMHYVEQDVNEKYGTALPVALVAEEFDLDEQVVFCNGDDFFWNVPSGSAVKDLIDGRKSEDEAVITGIVLDKAEIVKFAMIRKDEEGMLKDIVEKPQLEEVTTNLANINRFVLSAGLLRKIREYVKGNDFGPNDQEYMITDPIFEFISEGGKIRVAAAQGEWLDCGSVEGWLFANNLVLGK